MVGRPPFSGQVHAVAGIGFPDQFFRTLEGLGLQVLEHAFPDHCSYRVADLQFGDDLPVVMTDKDAAKVAEFSDSLPHDDYWVLEVRADLDRDLALLVMERLGLEAAGASLIEQEIAQEVAQETGQGIEQEAEEA